MDTKDIPLPSFGIDMLSPPAFAQRGSVRAAMNVDISADGTFRRRSGYSMLLEGSGFHSMHATSTGVVFGRNAELYFFRDATSTVHHIFSMMTDDRLDFAEYNGHLYITGPRVLCWLQNMKGLVRPVGVALPSGLPSIGNHGGGNLSNGEYAVAISWVDDRGEESPTAMLGVLPLVGGLRIENLEQRSGYRYRVFMSHANGSELYLASEFDATVSAHFVMTQPEGAPRATQHLVPMPAGNFVRGDKGRLYVAADDVLWFSDALRPHLTDPRTNFIQFAGQITFFEPMNDGIFVGDDRGVWWLAGTDPSKFNMVSVSDEVAIKRSSVLIPTAFLGPEFKDQENNSAVWLSTHGYMVGSNDGTVKSLHPERVRLAADLEGKSVFVVRNGVKQIVTLTAAAPSQQQPFGLPADFPLQ
jgi:hypothetical protein